MIPAKCRRCQSPNLTLRFDGDSVPSMVLNNEWISLAHFPATIACTDCGHEITGQGENFTIDITTGTILHGYIRGPK